MRVNCVAFVAIEIFEFPDEGYASLFDAIKTIREGYTPVVDPTFSGYYGKIDALYGGLRQMMPTLRERSANGESIDALAKETWDFFCSIQ